MMDHREVLEAANASLEQRGWCEGRLLNLDNGSHCSIGAIGHGRFGDEFDRLIIAYGDDQPGYDMIKKDPAASKAVLELANDIRRRDMSGFLAARGYFSPTSEDAEEYDVEACRRQDVLQAINDVVAYNDATGRLAADDTGHRIKEMFRTTKNRLRARLRRENRKPEAVPPITPPVPEVKIRRVAAEKAFPTGKKEKKKSTHKVEVK